MKKVTIAVVVATGMLSGTLLLGTSAVAGDGANRAEEFESRVTMKIKDRPGSDRLKFSGEIKSQEGECESNRKIRIERRGGGKIGATRTNRRGIYRFRIDRDDVAKGRYEAVARRISFRAEDGEKIVCERGRSRSEKVEKEKRNKDLKVDTNITLELTRGSQGDQYTPPGKARFSGKVSAKLDVCVADREVRIHVRGKGKFGIIVPTDANGNYSLEVDEPLDKGDYRARAERKIIEGDDGQTITCRPGRSNIVTVF